MPYLTISDISVVSILVRAGFVPSSARNGVPGFTTLEHTRALTQVAWAVRDLDFLVRNHFWPREMMGLEPDLDELLKVMAEDSGVSSTVFGLVACAAEELSSPLRISDLTHATVEVDPNWTALSEVDVFAITDWLYDDDRAVREYLLPESVLDALLPSATTAPLLGLFESQEEASTTLAFWTPGSEDEFGSFTHARQVARAI